MWIRPYFTNGGHRLFFVLRISRFFTLWMKKWNPHEYFSLLSSGQMRKWNIHMQGKHFKVALSGVGKIFRTFWCRERILHIFLPIISALSLQSSWRNGHSVTVKQYKSTRLRFNAWKIHQRYGRSFTLQESSDHTNRRFTALKTLCLFSLSLSLSFSPSV